MKLLLLATKTQWFQPKFFLGWHGDKIISTFEDPGSRIESFEVINLSGVSTNREYYMDLYDFKMITLSWVLSWL
jgi:hypothetical protein